MEIEKVSGDYRPLILVAEDDDSNFKLRWIDVTESATFERINYDI